MRVNIHLIGTICIFFSLHLPVSGASEQSPDTCFLKEMRQILVQEREKSIAIRDRVANRMSEIVDEVRNTEFIKLEK